MDTCRSLFHRASVPEDGEQYKEHASYCCKNEAVTEGVLEGGAQYI